ncbi:MAG: acyltransferase family protein [Lachnospiraceae bacterium]|nr:acyltransferase family protein [Lachnospiraceae bacterium]
MKKPQTAAGSRLNYLDIARGIGIILVILGHIEYIGSALKLFIVAFHMPFFFVTSGILIWLRSEAELPLKELVLKKLRRIMLPYIYFSVLDIIIYIVYYLLTGRDGGWNAVLLDVLQTVTLYGFSVMWFLPALFIAEMLFLLILKRFSRWAPLLVPAVTAVALALNAGLTALNASFGSSMVFQLFHMVAIALIRGMICMLFVAAGYAFTRFLRLNPVLSLTGPEPDMKKPEKTKILRAVPVLIRTFVGLDLLAATFFISLINGPVDLHFCVFGKIPLYFLGALSGSLGLVILCRSLEGVSRKKILFPLIYYGKNSLIVMATHMDFYILYVSEVAAFHFIKYVNHAKSYVFNTMIVIFVLIAEVFMIELINRFFPFLLGSPVKKRRKKN